MEPGETHPAEPPAAPADASGAAPVAEPAIDKLALREKVRELATVSGDLEMLTRQLARPQSQIQVGLLHDRMEQLTRMQRTLVQEIATQCPEASMRQRFEGLDHRLQALRAEVQETRDAEELERCRGQIDPLVDEWAQLFQQMVVTALQR